ncbi:MAG TPA: hypothetical protein VFY29_11045 [Terriglobia bacterium]|nr:hypothetical protein [Terriglobia bacterium]
MLERVRTNGRRFRVVTEAEFGSCPSISRSAGIGRIGVILALGLLVTVAMIALFEARGTQSRPRPARKQSVGDPIQDLQQRLDSGEEKLTFDRDTNRGYLASVLKALDIPVSSQTLVFSKSSAQLDYIAPQRPRALYFNDNVYVGWAQGAPALELASVDRTLGPKFYTLDQDEEGRPRFRQKTEECVVCHDAALLEQPVPRLLMLSVLPNQAGNAVRAYAMSTNDDSPFRNRWGGWYVTGTHGHQLHMGNVMVRMEADALDTNEVKRYIENLDRTPGANITDLSGRFDTKAYLAPSSDIVALMLLGHQTHVHNLITLASYEIRDAVAKNSPDTAKLVEEDGDMVLRAMLFARAEPLKEPVQGVSGFAEEFSREGPRDSRGRSLRDLDLKTRLLRYPLSYLIYSESFDAMPDPVRDYVLRRLREILDGKDQSADFASLTADDRQAILEILKETKPGF